jgi:hypothetical protein
MKTIFINTIWISLILAGSVGFKSTTAVIDTEAKIYLYKYFLIKTHPTGGIKIYSVANPASPFVINSLTVEGTHDVAIVDTIMYADRRQSLIVYNVADMNNPKHIDSLPNIFNAYDFSVMPMMDGVVESHGWSCFDCIPAPRSDAVVTPSTQTGQGGSMARFIIVNEYLYCIDQSSLVVFLISDPSKPVYRNRVQIGWDIETIFAKDSLLYIGGRFGMYVYDIARPDLPERLSELRHTRGCDPVVVEDTVAYVTVRDGTNCGAGTNQLIIVGVGDIRNPVVLKTYQFGSPAGLAVQNGILYLCDLKNGLKIFSIAHYTDLSQIFSFPTLLPHDVIVHNSILYTIGSTDINLYNVMNPNSPLFLSKLP